MIEPQSGQGGASSSGRKANGVREGSKLSAPTEGGALPDPAAFSRRITELMLQASPQER